MQIVRKSGLSLALVTTAAASKTPKAAPKKVATKKPAAAAPRTPKLTSTGDAIKQLPKTSEEVQALADFLAVCKNQQTTLARILLALKSALSDVTALVVTDYDSDQKDGMRLKTVGACTTVPAAEALTRQTNLLARRFKLTAAKNANSLTGEINGIGVRIDLTLKGGRSTTKVFFI